MSKQRGKIVGYHTFLEGKRDPKTFYKSSTDDSDFITRILAEEEKTKTDIQLIKWQPEALELLTSIRNTICNVFMGGGKSIFSKRMALEWYYKDPEHTKIIVCVPTRDIGLSFEREGDIIDGKYEWKGITKLCSGTTFQKSKLFQAFFRENCNGILVCTHSTLVRNYAAIKDYVDSNCHFFIDEGHRCSGDETSMNRLGEAYEAVFNQRAGTHLYTATFFRGDGMDIISEEIRKKHIIYRLSPAEYFKKYVISFKEFKYEVAFAENCEAGGWVNAIAEIAKRDLYKKTIIHQALSSGIYSNPKMKIEYGYQLIEKISDTKRQYWIECPKTGLIIAGTLRFLFFVDDDPQTRKKRVEYFTSKEFDADYIIALGMCKEGSNWVAGQRSIIFGAKNSLNELMQISGRVLRCWGKDKDGNVIHKEPEIIQVIPVTSKKVTEKNMRECAEDVVNCLAIGLIYGETVNPIILPRNKSTPSGVSRPRIDYILEMCNGNDQKAVGVYKAFIGMHIRKKKCRTDFLKFEKEAREYLEERGFVKYLNESIQVGWERMFIKLKSTSKGKYKFQSIIESDGVSKYFSRFGADKLEKLRNLYLSMAGVEEHAKMARKYNIKHTQEWRRTYKKYEKEFQHKKLYRCIQSSPFTFKETVKILPEYNKFTSKSRNLKDYIRWAKENNILNYTEWTKRSKELPDYLAIGLHNIFNPHEMILIFPNGFRKNILDPHKKQIINLFKNGMTIEDLSKKFKVKRFLIINSLNRWGISTKPLLYKNIHGKEWVRLYLEENKNCTEISKIYKISKFPILAYFKEMKIDIKSSGQCQRKYFKIINPNGEIIEGHGLCNFCKKNKISIDFVKVNKHRFYKYFHFRRNEKKYYYIYHTSGYCAYDPKLVGTTHQERIEKGLYQKYFGK